MFRAYFAACSAAHAAYRRVVITNVFHYIAVQWAGGQLISTKFLKRSATCSITCSAAAYGSRCGGVRRRKEKKENKMK